MGDANHMAPVDGAEVAAIEAVGRRGQDEDLARGESDAATPAWQRPPACIGRCCLCGRLAIDGQGSAVAADEITRVGCDRLDQVRPLAEVAARRREGAECVGKADDREFAGGWSRGDDPVEANRDARARVPQEARVARPWARDGQDA
jgi:hypothetical protein